MLLLPLNPANIVDVESISELKGIKRTIATRKIIKFLVIPALFGILTGVSGKSSVDFGSLLAAIAVYTGLVFNLLFHVFDKSLAIRKDPFSQPSKNEIELADKLYANVSWTVYEGLFIASLLSLPLFFNSPSTSARTIFLGVVAATMTHLVLLSLTILQRFSALRLALKD